MLTTPIFGIPYAEPDDPTREYPATVDAPAKSIIDTQLGRSPTKHYVQLKLSANTASIPGGAITKIPALTTVVSRGTSLAVTTGFITINAAGTYLIGGGSVVIGIPAGNHSVSIVHTNSSGVQLTPIYYMMAGLNVTIPVGTEQAGASFCIDALAGQQLHLGFYSVASGAQMMADTWYYAARIG